MAVAIDPKDKAACVVALEKVYRDEQRVPVDFGVWEMWLTMSTLQMSVTHPRLGPVLREHCTVLARIFQGKIVELHPELEALAEAGWNRT